MPRSEQVRREVAPPPRDIEGTIVVRFLLPVQPKQPGSFGKWQFAAPVVDGFSNPNRIVYDDELVQAFLPEYLFGPPKCGQATYTIATPAGEVQHQGGLDDLHLGQKFRADDLVRFLRARVEGDREERAVRVRDPQSIRHIREFEQSQPSGWKVISPWDYDIEAAISLLSGIRYKPAYPYLKAMVKDPNSPVRYWAVMGLGRLAPVVPEAIDVIAPLLSDKELGAAAADALMMAGKVAVPTIIKAFDGSGIVANRAVFALARMEFADAEPALLAALNHRKPFIREWARDVVQDMSTRGVTISFEVRGAMAKVIDDDK